MVLAELKWRELPLNENYVDPLHLEGLIYCLAKHNRSEVGYAIHSLLHQMTDESRLIMYMVLLSVVENIPTRAPLHHMLTPPSKHDQRNTWHEALRPS